MLAGAAEDRDQGGGKVKGKKLVGVAYLSPKLPSGPGIHCSHGAAISHNPLCRGRVPMEIFIASSAAGNWRKMLEKLVENCWLRAESEEHIAGCGVEVRIPS